MPPSDDTQGLLAEGSSSASHEASTVMMVVDATPIVSESASLDSSLQDQLANVFEEKMSPRPELEESPMTATSETSSNCSSQEAAITELQQPSLEKPVQEKVTSTAVESEENAANAQESASEENTTEETAAETPPLSLSDTAEIIETTAQQEIGEQATSNEAEGDAENAEKDGPLSMIRKGAVAAV
ncbi:MAG: hypothetical protein SGARI_004929, partial [Bacillariaceae sp.]